MNNFIIKFITVALFVNITGCAGLFNPTPYQPYKYNGGYKELKLTKNTYQVYFSGNNRTDTELARKYLLLRCAALTIDNHYNFFVVTDYGFGGIGLGDLGHTATIKFINNSLERKISKELVKTNKSKLLFFNANFLIKTDTTYLDAASGLIMIQSMAYKQMTKPLF